MTQICLQSHPKNMLIMVVFKLSCVINQLWFNSVRAFPGYKHFTACCVNDFPVTFSKIPNFPHLEYTCKYPIKTSQCCCTLTASFLHHVTTWAISQKHGPFDWMHTCQPCARSQQRDSAHVAAASSISNYNCVDLPNGKWLKPNFSLICHLRQTHMLEKHINNLA